jgi:hypothetical protein
MSDPAGDWIEPAVIGDDWDDNEVRDNVGWTPVIID